MSEDFWDGLYTERHEAQHEADRDAYFADQDEFDAEVAVIGEELHASHEGWDYPQTNDSRRAVA